MNHVAKRIRMLANPESGTLPDYKAAHSLIAEYGKLVGTGESGIRYYRINESVFCVRSHTQIDFAGFTCAKPFFRLPEHARPVTVSNADEP